MKRIIAIICMAVIASLQAQTNYNDLGVLMSQNDNYGTSRFEAMSGAFGALGSDISSLQINPAGMSVSNISVFTITGDIYSLSSNSIYYGDKTNFENDYFSVSQAGATMVFNSASNWNNMTLSFNYNKKADFNGLLKGKSKGKFFKFGTHLKDTNPPTYDFDKSLEHEFSNATSGGASVFNLGISSSYKNQLYLGASFNFHSFEYRQSVLRNEVNEDKNGYRMVASNDINSLIATDGFSLGLGLIYKINHNLRVGLAYETPTWFTEITEDNEDYLVTGAVEGTNLSKADDSKNESFIYNFKTPSRFTLSTAYIFGKQGLISIDYTYKNYRKMKYQTNDDGFIRENESFMENYKNTHSLNIGGEWRIKALSLRGGYHYQQTPNKLVKASDLNGFSLGAGYNFGSMKLDVSYRNDSFNSSYPVYNVNDLNTDYNTSRITGTLTFNL